MAETSHPTPNTQHPIPISGLYLVNKPVGPSSAAVVGRIKYLLIKSGQPKKGPGRLVIGHGGTLDPLACGLLPIGLGKGTKLLQPLLEGPKTYRFTVRFGTQTATDDAEGAAIATTATLPTQAQLEAVLPLFTGEITQTPPAFSALKVNGKRAYERARQGEEVALAPRPVTIHSLQFLPDPHTLIPSNPQPLRPSDPQIPLTSATLVAEVSKGTYIRVLARDLAAAAGSLGYVTELIRTAHGPFTLEQAVDLETLDKALQSGHTTAHLRDMAALLAALPVSRPGRS